MLKLFEKDVFDFESKIDHNFVSHLCSTLGAHCHDFFEFFLVVDGSAFHNVNKSRQLVTKGSMILIRPDDVHFFEKNGIEDCQYVNIVFSAGTLYDLIHYVGNGYWDNLINDPLPPSIRLNTSDYSILQKKILRLSIMQVDKKEQAKSYFRLLLSDLMFNYFSNYKSGSKMLPEWLDEIIFEMGKAENIKSGLPEMHRLSKKSPEHLCRIFKTYLHITPTDFLNELRLNHAASMLAYSSADIIDIVYECGYNNLSHFYHLFKKKFGETPSKFRKSNQKISKM